MEGNQYSGNGLVGSLGAALRQTRDYQAGAAAIQVATPRYCIPEALTVLRQSQDEEYEALAELVKRLEEGGVLAPSGPEAQQAAGPSPSVTPMEESIRIAGGRARQVRSVIVSLLQRLQI